MSLVSRLSSSCSSSCLPLVFELLSHEWIQFFNSSFHICGIAFSVDYLTDLPLVGLASPTEEPLDQVLALQFYVFLIAREWIALRNGYVAVGVVHD